MKSFFVLLLLAIICFASCLSEKPNEIRLFNSFKFQKDSSELIAEIDSLSKMPYEQYFNNIDKIQLPLYRIIQGKDYTLYLGIPFHTNLKKLSEARAEKQNSDTTFVHRKEAMFSFMQYKKDSLFFTEYIRNIDTNSIVCIFAFTKNQSIFDSVLNEARLGARIIK